MKSLQQRPRTCCGLSPERAPWLTICWTRHDEANTTINGRMLPDPFHPDTGHFCLGKASKQQPTWQMWAQYLRGQQQRPPTVKSPLCFPRASDGWFLDHERKAYLLVSSRVGGSESHKHCRSTCLPRHREPWVSLQITSFHFTLDIFYCKTKHKCIS